MACIFLTNEVTTIKGEVYGGVFKDMVAIDVFSGDLHVLCRGQWEGRADNVIINNTVIHIFSRTCMTDTYIYWGTASKEWTTDRVLPVGVKAAYNQLSVFKLIIKRRDIIKINIPRNTLYTGPGCLKKACLAHLGKTDFSRVNITHCFIEL